jgi:hypothetical protein
VMANDARLDNDAAAGAIEARVQRGAAAAA